MVDQAYAEGQATNMVRRFCPEFKVRAKSGSRLMRLLGLVLGRSFREDFWTTVGFTAYAPSKSGQDSWQVLLHEGGHAVDAKRWTRVLYALLYLLPFLPFRAWAEERGYQVSVAAEYWYEGGISAGREVLLGDRLVELFTGPSYLFMWPFKRNVRKRLGVWIARLRAGEPQRSDAYLAACEMLARRMRGA